MTDLLILIVLAVPALALIVASVFFYAAVFGSVWIPPWRFVHKVWFGYRMNRIERRSTVQIREGAPARIVGQISALREPLRAPLSHRPCAYYRVVVERWIGDRFNTYVKILEEERGSSFILRDEGGEVQVELSGARILAEMDAYYESGAFQSATPNLQAFLARHGRSSKNIFGFNKALRYRESILGHGEKISACGMVKKAGEGFILAGDGTTAVRVSDVVGWKEAEGAEPTGVENQR